MSDTIDLDRELDKAKTRAFVGKSAAFMGSILCSLLFSWDNSIRTAAVDGVTLFWNPDFFRMLLPKTRETVLIHELLHVAYLHFIRMGSRDPMLWNMACDHKINLDLIAMGYSFEGIEWALKDPQYKGMAEEQIYDHMVKNGIKPPPNYVPSMKPSSAQDKITTANTVIRAIHHAKAANAAGTIPGDIEEVLRVFLTPVVRWEQVLLRFMSELLDDAYTWRKPNRRYPNMYLPSSYEDEGRLQHLAAFSDVSGSISDADKTRFNSELKYIWDTFGPKKLTLGQFDTRITKIETLNEGDPFDEVKMKGGGGTNLEPVRQWIIENKPTAVIIFSDLECRPMAKLPFDVPIIWIGIRTRRTVPFGTITYIQG